MASTDWDPQQYERFKEQRSQPFWDLIALIDSGGVDRAVDLAVDLGCGTGELTAQAARRLGVGSMVGVDNSPTMLDAASAYVSSGVRFEVGDIGAWTAEPTLDLVVANASLQWVPEHAAVLERWVAALRPGGQVAVQVPANADHPSHLASAAVATREPFVSAFDGSPPADPVAVNVLRPEEYAVLLYELGIAEPHVRLQVYPHVMPSSEAVVEWTKGTSLTRFFKVLPTELHEGFVEAYREELLARIGRHEPYLYPFKRILMWGRVTLG